MNKILEDILKNIQERKRNKKDLLQIYVKERIDKQIESYYSQLLDSYEILCHQNNEIKVVKKLVENKSP